MAKLPDIDLSDLPNADENEIDLSDLPSADSVDLSDLPDSAPEGNTGVMDVLRAAAPLVPGFGGAASVVEAGANAPELLQKAGEVATDYKEGVAYSTSPQGLMEKGYEKLDKAFAKGGEFITEEGVRANREGKNPLPEGAWRAIGVASGFIPDIISLVANPIDPADKVVKGAAGLVDDAKGLTPAGERVARMVEESAGGAVARAEVAVPTKMTTPAGTEVGRTALPMTGNMEDMTVLLNKATAAESKLRELTSELDNIKTGGPAALAPSKAETAWMTRMASLKAQRDELAAIVENKQVDVLLKQRPAKMAEQLAELTKREQDTLKKLSEELRAAENPGAYIAQLPAYKKARLKFETRMGELKEQEAAIRATFEPRLSAQEPSSPKLAKMQEMLNKRLSVIEKRRDRIAAEFAEARQSLVARGDVAANTSPVKVAEVQKKMRDATTSFAERRKAAVSSFMDASDKALVAASEKLNKLDVELGTLKTQYQASLKGRFAKRVGQLKEAAAWAENDLVDLGYTADEVQTRLADLLDRNIGVVTEGGTEVSKEVIEAIRNYPNDISGTDSSFLGLKYFTDQVDNASGAGAFRREIEAPTYDAIVRRRDLEVGYKNKLKEIMDKHGVTPKDSKHLGLFIEGKVAAPKGKEAKWGAFKNQLKELTDDLFKLENEFLAKKGLPPIGYRENYVHSMRERVVVDDLLGGDVQKYREYFNTKRTHPNAGFEKTRYDAIPESERLGAIEATDAYIGKVMKRVFLSDHTERLRLLAREAKGVGKIKLSQHLDDLASVLTGDFNRLSSTGGDFFLGRTVSNFIKSPWFETGMNNTMKGLLAFNVSSAVNQVKSQILSSAYVGGPRAVAGTFSGIGTQLYEQIVKAILNPEYMSFAARHSKQLKLMALQDVEKLGITTGSNVVKVGMKGMNFMNEAMAAGTFNQAYKAARATGRSHELAVKIADEITARSQGIYEDAFRPIFLNSAGGKLLTPLSTYVFNALNALNRDVLFSGLSPAEKITVLGQMVATGAVLEGGLFLATGRGSTGPGDFIPMFNMAKYGLTGPLSILAKAVSGDFQRAGEAAAMAANPYGGTLQALKTTKGAARILSGEDSDPRQLLFGPKPKKR